MAARCLPDNLQLLIHLQIMQPKVETVVYYIAYSGDL